MEAHMALTAKQSAFVREYAKDFNATQAAARAGYSDANYGRQLLANPNVAAEVAKLHDEARTNAVLTLSELQEWWSATIRGEHPDAAFRDQQKASEMLAKSQGGFTERVEQTGAININVKYADD